MEDRSDEEWASERLVKTIRYRVLVALAAFVLIACIVLSLSWEILPAELKVIDRQLIKYVGFAAALVFVPAITAAHAPAARKNAKIFDTGGERAKRVYSKLRRIGFSCLALAAAIICLQLAVLDPDNPQTGDWISIAVVAFFVPLCLGVAALQFIGTLKTGQLLPPNWLLRILGEDDNAP